LRFGGTKAIFLGLTVTPALIFIFAAFRTISSQEASAKGRLWAWWDGLEMLKSNPILGVGSNNFIEHHNRVAHNTYIQMAAELGFTGYILWTSVLLITLFMAFSVMKYAKTINFDESSEYLKENIALCNTFFYSLCGFAMTAFFLTRNFFIIYYIIAGLCMASFLRVIKLSENDKIFDLKKVMKKVLLIEITIIIFIYIILKFTV
jgi:O-antigen ligase